MTFNRVLSERANFVLQMPPTACLHLLLTLLLITIHQYLVLWIWILQIGLEFLSELPLPIPFRCNCFIYLNPFLGPRRAVRRFFFCQR
jgi:hypothetical protein